MTGHSTDAFTGSRILSFKASEELRQLLDAVARSEGRNRSGMIRRAILHYCADTGVFDGTASLDSDGSLVRALVEDATKELETDGS